MMFRKTQTPRYHCISGENYCFNILEKLGAGTYGTVWKAMDTKAGKFCAIKILKEQFYKEKDIWNLPEDCDLSKLIVKRGRDRPFPEYEVRSICFQILRGLASVHSQGYCHRDLKPQNILVSGKVIKISDFGEATSMTLHESGRPQEPYVVTRPYRAPELLLGSTHYDFAIDMWAMGAIMLELFTGYQLFRSFCVGRQWYKICSLIGTPNNKSWAHGVKLANKRKYALPKEFMKVDSTKQLSSLIPSASREAIDLINSLLSWDPKKRPRPEAALQHPFFQLTPLK
eukprot:PITA_25329